ncbi:MAG: pentapeptide repeat-containing protein [Cyanobacteria bacterium RM1_2_2]|nr:pentapeptide repeat-containing protein [Cyanobacteria bacterium RM1_2_2]
MTISKEAGQNESTGKGASNATNEPKKTNPNARLEWTKAILFPLAIALTGWYLSGNQFKITNLRQDADSAAKAIETREQVLTDYSKTIADLLTKNKTTDVTEYGMDAEQKNITRGQTLIALRRLNIPDKNDKSDVSQNEEDDESQNDAGKLKGLLIRYLYDAQIIGYGYSSSNKPAMVTLSGADIKHVVLENAWLPRINLRNAELDKSNFRNASLWSANLQDAKLAGADLTGADLRFAMLQSATLEKATLKKACYVEGTEATYFPLGFEPETFDMVAIPEDQSYPSKPNFQRCKAVASGPTP